MQKYRFYSFDRQDKIILDDAQLDKYPDSVFSIARKASRDIHKFKTKLTGRSFEQLEHFFETGKWINPECPNAPHLQSVGKNLSFEVICEYLKLPYDNDVIEEYDENDIFYYHCLIDQ